MRITEATENYMEAILVLERRNGAVRPVDVANYLGFSKPTISQYMKHYVSQGLVEIGGDGHILLTESGREIAEHIYERHQVIASIFMALGVPEQTAVQDACKVEHDLSEETFRCMKAHYMKSIRK